MGSTDGESLRDGICGSAMWNEEGDVVGFFQYAPDSGCMANCCTGVSAAELIKAGHSLVETP